MAKRKGAHSTALTIPGTTDVAISHDALVESAKSYARQDKAVKTKQLYAVMLANFHRWCEQYGQDPAQLGGEAAAAYVTWLADGGTGVRYAKSSITCAVSALFSAMPAEQVQAIKANKVFQSVCAGVRRDIAGRRTVRQAAPLMFADIRDLLDLVRTDNPREVCDACVLALGSAGALRRSELAGLDYGELGTTPDDRRQGFLAIDERGIVITLMRSKASQETSEEIVIPRDFAPLMIRWVETWVTVGRIAKGTPLLRGVEVSAQTDSERPQSGFVGVRWEPSAAKWRAMVRVNGKPTHLGMFVDPYEAHVAVCRARSVEPNVMRFAGAVTPRRLADYSISLIVKRAVTRLMIARARKKGMKAPTADQIAAMAKKFSGHSMRAGYVTSAHLAEMPVERIRQHTRHKNLDTLTKYIRVADKHTNSGLKGVGF